MADMPKPGTPQMQNPAPAQGVDSRMDAKEGQSVAALQTLVEEQVAAYLKTQGQDSQAVSLPEILADESGAFAKKAQELGLTKEFEAFKNQVPQIAALRQDLVGVAEQLQTGMNGAEGQKPEGQASGQNPQGQAPAQNPQAELQKKIEEETAAVKTSGRTGGIVSAVLGGVASGFAAFKFSNKGNVFKASMTALGAAVAGGMGAVVAAKRRATKSADTILAMQEKLEQAGPAASTPGVDPALEAKAQELYMQMENAQGEALSPLLDVMVARMAQKDAGQQMPQSEQEVQQEVKDGVGKFEAMLKDEAATRATGNGQQQPGGPKSFAAAETQAGSRQEALRAQALRAQEQGAAVGK